MREHTQYWLCTWQPGSCGERMLENYIAGPFSDPDEARTCRERVGSDLAIFQIADDDEEPNARIE